MKHFWRLSALLILSSWLLTSGLQAGKPIVVVLSLDAFRADYHSLHGTPNLDSLALEGVNCQAFQPCFPSITFPNHYAMATGLYPNSNGLVHNTFFNKKLQKKYSIGDRKAVEDGRFYGGEPIWLTAHKNGLSTASFFWVGSESKIQGYQPDRWKPFDAKVSFETRIDSVIAWLSLPDAERPQLVMFYFDEPDHTTHSFDPAGPVSAAMVKRCDSLVGVCNRRLKALPCANDIHFIVVSDHGMCPLDSNKRLYIDAVIPPNFITYNNYGSPCRLLDIKPEKLDSALLLIQQIPHLQAWKAGEVPERLHYGTHENIGNLILVADSAYSFARKNWKFDMAGAHGYDNQNPTMQGIFYGRGPAFQTPSVIMQLPNIQLYNIIARILQIQPAPNDADPKEIEALFKR